jgi:hypothetical protein
MYASIAERIGADFIYQVIHKQLFNSKIKCENVYFYNHIAGTGNAANLATDFLAVIDLVNAMQSANVVNTGTDVINLGDTSDFQSDITTGAGINVAESMPALNAISFTVKPDNRAVRHGGKRITGIPEASAVIDEITSAPILAAMEAYRVQLQANLVGAGDTWQPIIVKRVRTAVAGTVPLRYTYRLPATDSELVFAGVLVASSNVFLSSQVSRHT